MQQSGQPERHTQNRVIHLLRSEGLGYSYLGNWDKGVGRRNGGFMSL